MQVEPVGPKCPGCSKRPFNRDMGMDKFPNGVLCAVISCRDCGHVLATFMVGMEQPEPSPLRGGLEVVKN